MITKSMYLRNYSILAVFVGACGYLWGCGARSGMLDMPEDDLPSLPGAGGAPTTTGGSAGTSEATGGTFLATGGMGGTHATGGTGGTHPTGGTGGTHATGGTGGTHATSGMGGSPATSGMGGSPAAGGTGGSPAMGGTGGGFIGSCEYPSCLWNLIHDCLVAGQCTQDDSVLADGSTEITKLCCNNGTNELVTWQTQGSRHTGSVGVTKNGNKCYDVNITTSGDGTTISYVWLDPSGQAVVKTSIGRMADSGPPVLQCGNGESMPMASECAPDGSQAAEITTGTCP